MVLLASKATLVAVKDEKRKRFKRCAAQIARPNTAPTGRWLARGVPTSERQQYLQVATISARRFSAYQTGCEGWGRSI